MKIHTQSISKKIRLEKETHRGKTIISLYFKGKKDWLRTIKELPDISFSRTKSVWYIPYSKESYNRFLTLNLPFSIPSSGTHVGDKTPTEVSALDHDKTGISISSDGVMENPETELSVSNINDQKELIVEWNSRKFILDKPYKPDYISKVKQLEGAWWNHKAKKWICKGTLFNLKKIHDFWEPWSDNEYDLLFKKISLVENPCSIQLYYSPKYNNMVCIKLKGFGTNHQIIKSFSGWEYIREKQLYILPYLNDSIKELCKRYEEIGYTLENRLPSKNQESHETSNLSKVNFFLDKISTPQITDVKRLAFSMLSMNYGVRTIKSYCGKILRLMEYTHKTSMEDISAMEVKAYIEYLTKKSVSFSLINHVHSAVKLYHEKVSYNEEFEIKKLTRPKSNLSLPKFLSENEVLRLFDNISNLKHLAILYMLYGSGVRRAELLGIELNHIYWDRNQVLIQRGKGNKDRMVNLSEVAKLVLDQYFHEYSPQKYLFEGLTPGLKYSGGSISNIIKKAAAKAGITKNVTPHMLRHSFATHLMDQGIAIPKIQKLLGHKDIKTTLIYTHVTNADLSTVISPLDKLGKSLK